MMPTKHSWRTFLDEVFIQNAKSYWRTSPTLTFPLSFTIGNGSHCVTFQLLVLSCLSRSFTLTCTGFIVQYLFSLLAFEVHTFLSHSSLLRMCFKFLGSSFLTTLIVSVYGLCPRMSSWLLSARALLIGVIVSLHHVGFLLKFLDSLMTFVLHPLSHYNSITEPRARFLLSLLEHLTIDFPSHFIDRKSVV